MGGGGGGGTLIFSYISRLGHCFSSNFEFQYFWGFSSFGGFKILYFKNLYFSEKMNMFWGMKIMSIFLGGNHKI